MENQFQNFDDDQDIAEILKINLDLLQKAYRHSDNDVFVNEYVIEYCGCLMRFDMVRQTSGGFRAERPTHVQAWECSRFSKEVAEAVAATLEPVDGYFPAVYEYREALAERIIQCDQLMTSIGC